MANSVIHTAGSRGFANHGWLKSHHTFSFANYYNPERTHFGALRVLNDDQVEAGMGFGTHPHDNMEIVSIPLEGDLEHRDSLGTVSVIRRGDVQIMSAGTGVTHSEYNKNKDQQVKFLQIWIIPAKRNIQPRYDQMSLREEDRHNRLQQIISPNKEEGSLWINQNAWFHIGKFDAGKKAEYTLKAKENGVYAFLLSGSAKVNDTTLAARDGFGVWGVSSLKIEALSDMELLLMEVPMTV